MLSFRNFLIENKRLLHGTIIDNVPNIRSNWLQPSVGNHTKRFYDDAEEALYFADQHDVKRAKSSILGHIALKLKKPIHHVTGDDVEKHGALIISRTNNSNQHSVHKYNEDGTSHDMSGFKHYSNPPPQTEPGDIYTKDQMKPTGVLTGKRLRQFLERR